jgi:hypothetical protein
MRAIVILLILLQQLSPTMSEAGLLFPPFPDGCESPEPVAPARDAQSHTGALTGHATPATTWPDRPLVGTSSPRRATLRDVSTSRHDDIDLVRLHRQDGQPVSTPHMTPRAIAPGSGDTTGARTANRPAAPPTMPLNRLPPVVLRC